MSAADSLSASNPPAGCGALYAGTNQSFRLRCLGKGTPQQKDGDAVRETDSVQTPTAGAACGARAERPIRLSGKAAGWRCAAALCAKSATIQIMPNLPSVGRACGTGAAAWKASRPISTYRAIQASGAVRLRSLGQPGISDRPAPVPANPTQSHHIAQPDKTMGRVCDPAQAGRAAAISAYNCYSAGLAAGVKRNVRAVASLIVPAARPIPRGPQAERGSPGAVVLSPAPGL